MQMLALDVRCPSVYFYMYISTVLIDCAIFNVANGTCVFIYPCVCIFHINASRGCLFDLDGTYCGNWVIIDGVRVVCMAYTINMTLNVPRPTFGVPKWKVGVGDRNRSRTTGGKKNIKKKSYKSRGPLPFFFRQCVCAVRYENRTFITFRSFFSYEKFSGSSCILPSDYFIFWKRPFGPSECLFRLFAELPSFVSDDRVSGTRSAIITTADRSRISYGIYD